LYNRSRVRLIKPALTYGIGLRQTCSRLGPRAVLKVGRYHHARRQGNQAAENLSLSGVSGYPQKDQRAVGTQKHFSSGAFPWPNAC
jgi:hypothetical protein